MLNWITYRAFDATMLLLMLEQFVRKLLGKWHPAESNNLTGIHCARFTLENNNNGF